MWKLIERWNPTGFRNRTPWYHIHIWKLDDYGVIENVYGDTIKKQSCRCGERRRLIKKRKS